VKRSRHTASVLVAVLCAAASPQRTRAEPGSQTQSQAAATVRVGGVYQSEPLGEGLWMYLLFQADGVVRGAGSSGTPAQVLRWLPAGENKGTYKITGSSIRFSTTSTQGTVDYEGTIEPSDRLTLNSISHINGARSRMQFQYGGFTAPGANATAKPAANSTSTMTNNDVIQMVTASLSEQVITTAIRQAQAKAFDLTPTGLIALKKAQVSDAVILAMQGDTPAPAQ